MTSTDRERWDERYVQAASPAPTRPLALDVFPDFALPSMGRALDIACGTGAQALWLTAHGFVVDAVDISPRALAAGRHAAYSVNWVEADLDDWAPSPSTYDVVLCQRFRDPRLFATLGDALAPGGSLIVTVLSVVGHFGPPSEFRAAPGELLGAFGRLDIVGHHEEAGLAHLVARRPG